MALPKLSDFRTYIGKLLDNNDWDFNWQKLIEIFTLGTFDVNFNTVTATTLIGDVSQTTGFPTSSKVKVQLGEAVSLGDVLRFDAGTGKAFKADNGSSLGITNFIGFAESSGLLNETISVERSNFEGLTGLTVGAIYFIGTAGAITTTEPATFPKAIGYPVSTQQFLINPNAQATQTFSEIEVNGQVESFNTAAVYFVYNKSTGTILKQKNLISIVSNGLGRFTATWSAGILPDINYIAYGLVQDSETNGVATLGISTSASRTTTSARFAVSDNSVFLDATYICVAIFRG